MRKLRAGPRTPRHLSKHLSRGSSRFDSGRLRTQLRQPETCGPRQTGGLAANDFCEEWRLRTCGPIRASGSETEDAGAVHDGMTHVP